MTLKPVLQYALFFAAALVVFLFLLFPQKQVAVYLSRVLTDPVSDLHISIDNVKPVFPLCLEFENTTFFLDQNTQIVPESFNVCLTPASLFKQKKHLKFTSGLLKGSITGRLDLNSIDPFVFSQAVLSLSHIKINNFHYQTELADIVLGCDLTGEYQQMEAKDTKDSGHGKIFIQQFSSTLKDSLFNTLNLPKIDFSEIKLEFTHHPKTITLIQCTARGSIINVNVHGSIEPVFPLEETRLHLTGILLPDSPYLAKFANMAAVKSVAKTISTTGIKFNINGTLKHPKIEI